MPLTFTAIDYETANNERASACSVGFTVVQDGEIVCTDHIYISPPTGLRFTNSWLHGITPQHVFHAPSFKEVMYQTLAANPGAPFVAYSAFDKGVWNAAWRLIGDEAPPSLFLDALALSRRLLSLPAYRLPAVAEALGVAGFEHHRADADADACAQIVLELARRTEVEELHQLWPTKKREIEQFQQSAYSL